MSEFLSQYWLIFTTIISFVAWLVRLEAKSIDNARRIEKLEDQHQTIEQMALDIREMKTDMKWLLKETIHDQT